MSLREKRDLEAGEAIKDWSSGKVIWRDARLGLESWHVLVCGEEWDWRAYDVLAVNPTFCVSDEFFFSFILLVAFFDCAFEDPGQSFGNHDISLIDDGISSTARFSLCNAATVTTTAVAGGIG